MRQCAWIGIALLAMSQFTTLPSALAQSGSIGGSVGKLDKSISGGAEPGTPCTAPQPKRAAAKTQESASSHRCGRIVGRWSWYLGVSDSVFHKDGTAFHPASGTNGKWTCAGDTVSVVWGNGGSSRTDRITVSQDGNGIFVDSPWGGGIKFTGARRGQD